MAIYGHRRPQGEEKERRREKKPQTVCLIIPVNVLPRGSVNLGNIYTYESLISFTPVLGTLSILRSHRRLFLWETPLFVMFKVFLHRALLTKHQRQLDSMFCGFDRPRGQELLILLVTHFNSMVSSLLVFLFLPLLAFWKVLKYS